MSPAPAVQTINLLCAWLAVVFTVSVVLFYSLRVVRAGRAGYARVDAQGSSHLLNRPMMEMGYWGLQSFGKAMARTGLTPNQISVLSLFTGVGGGVALGFGNFGIGGFLAMLSGFLDVLDGMVARATGVSSDSGEVVDAAIDRYTEYAFFGGLLVYYRAYPLLQVLALVAMVGSSMVTYSSAKAEALHVKVPSAMMRRHERSTYMVAGALLSAFSVGGFEATWPYHPAIGVPMVVVLVAVGVLANVAAVRRLRAVASGVAARGREAR